MSDHEQEAIRERNLALYEANQEAHRAAAFSFRVNTVLREMSIYGLHLLNTTIIPAAGLWVVQDIEPEDAKRLHYASLDDFNINVGEGPQSHIGHTATAAVITELHGTQVQVDRTPWDGRGVGLALQMKGRIPEGSILTREQMEAMGYSWRLLVRVSEDPMAELEAARQWRGHVEACEALERRRVEDETVANGINEREAAYRAGHIAAWRGEARSACPFDYRSPLAGMWQRGFLAFAQPDTYPKW